MNFSEILKVGDWVELRNGEKGKVVSLRGVCVQYPIEVEIEGGEYFHNMYGKYFNSGKSDKRDIIRKIAPINAEEIRGGSMIFSNLFKSLKKIIPTCELSTLTYCLVAALFIVTLVFTEQINILSNRISNLQYQLVSISHRLTQEELK